MFFQPLGELDFGQFAGSERHHHRVGLFFVGKNFPSILLEEDVHENEGDSFVTINERMVSTNVESVSGGFVKDGLMDKLAADRDFRLGECGIEQIGVTQSWTSTISLQKVGVNSGDNSVWNESPRLTNRVDELQTRSIHDTEIFLETKTVIENCFGNHASA